MAGNRNDLKETHQIQNSINNNGLEEVVLEIKIKIHRTKIITIMVLEEMDLVLIILLIIKFNKMEVSEEQKVHHPTTILYTSKEMIVQKFWWFGGGFEEAHLVADEKFWRGGGLRSGGFR